MGNNELDSEVAQKEPGKSHREGISILELGDIFPDEDGAAAWFEAVIWPEGRHCPRCGSTETMQASATSGLPYYCRGCRKTFSVRTGTALQRSKVSFRKWVLAIYLEMTNLKGVSSMKLHRDIKVTQKTAWFMLHRIREAWKIEAASFTGPVEADETYMGGLRKNMPKSIRKELSGRGSVGKTVVDDVKDRGSNSVLAKVFSDTTAPTLQGFVRENTETGAIVYTNEAYGYRGLAGDFGREAVNQGVGEYVRSMAYTNGIESFWSMLQRARKGVYHKISAKHFDRDVHEFAGRHNVRELDAIEQMGAAVAGIAGRSLMYQDLFASNDLDSGAR